MEKSEKSYKEIEDIALIIKNARKSKGLTQKELASLCDCATGTIQQYELGKRKPSYEQLIKIMLCLDIDISKYITSNIIFSDIDDILHNLSSKKEFQMLDFKQSLEDISKLCNAGDIAILTTILEIYPYIDIDGKKELMKRAIELNKLQKIKET